MTKILVVEDDPFNVELFDLVLKRIGKFETVITEVSDEIFSLLKKDRIDLIIMDVSLENTYINNKKVDGKQLSKIIKQHPATKNIPIIIVTAYATKEDIKDIIRDSLADECVTKPITNYHDFVVLIKKHIN